MIDIFDILFLIALIFAVCCVCVSYQIYREIPYKGIGWLMGAFIVLVLTRLITCFRGLGLLVVDSDVNSAIGVVTIALLLAGMFSLLRAIQKYKHTNGNGK